MNKQTNLTQNTEANSTVMQQQQNNLTIECNFSKFIAFVPFYQTKNKGNIFYKNSLKMNLQQAIAPHIIQLFFNSHKMKYIIIIPFHKSWRLNGCARSHNDGSSGSFILLSYIFAHLFQHSLFNFVIIACTKVFLRTEFIARK